MNRLFLLYVLLFCSSSMALNTGDMRLGIQAGQVGLLQDVGGRSGNAVGFGAFFNFAASEDLMFEIGYLSSQHTRLSHSEVPIGINYYFENSEKLAYQALAGATFISHSLQEHPVDLSSSGFGLYIGAGLDLDVSNSLKSGVQLRYVKGFEQTVQLATGERIASIQDHYTLMLRLAYEFPANMGK